MEDSSPSEAHLAVMVAVFEPRFHRTTANRLPESGPAQTWNNQMPNEKSQLKRENFDKRIQGTPLTSPA